MLVLGTSLVVQWLTICLAMPGTPVRPLVRELRSHIPWVIKPELRSYWALTLQSPRVTTGESAPQQKIPQDTMKTARATTETRRSQRNKYFLKRQPTEWE